MKTLVAILFANLTLTVIAQASGTTIGNGGFVVSCENKIQLLDYYEIEQKGLSLEEIPGANLDEKVEYLLSKLEKIDPNRAKNYRFQYVNYWNKKNRILNVEGLHLNYEQTQNQDLLTRFGIGKVNIPKSCELVLAVSQYYSPVEGAPLSISIYEPVWERLDLNTKAGIILHELFYREYLVKYHKLLSPTPQNLNSMSVRHLNGILGAQIFYQYDVKSWITMLNEEKFSAMFPFFVTSSEGEAIDMEPNLNSLAEVQWNDYALNTLSHNEGKNPVIIGKVNFKYFSNTEVIANAHQYREILFFNGLFPKVFSLTKPTIIDLSQDTHFNLKLNVSPECLVEISRELILQSVTGMYSEYCESYLELLKHPEIQFSGPIRVYYTKPFLFLNKSEFSILQVFDNDQWKDVANIKLNTNTGEIKEYN